MSASARRSAALAGFGIGLLLAASFLWRCAIEGTVPARLDLVDFFWPMKAYTAARWKLGGVPLWNPLSGCGEPWLAQLQTGAFYPGDLPFFLPPRFAPLVAITLHLAIAAGGMAAWLDDLGASRPAAFTGAAVFAGAGAYLSLVPVYNNACSAAFLPWIFLGARRVVRGAPVTMLVASAALGLLAGEPGITAAGTIAAILIAFATGREGEPGHPEAPARTLARIAGALVLTAGVAAVALLPFAELVSRSGRLGSVTREEALGRPLTSSDLADLVVPQSAAASRRFRSDRSGYLTSLALGPGPLLLAAACAAGFPGRRRLLGWLALLGLAGLLLSLGAAGRLAPSLFDLGLLRMRYPARWFIFTHLFVALAAGAGLDGWLYGRFVPRLGRAPREGEAVAADSVDTHSPVPAALAAGAGVAVLAILAAFALADRDGRNGPRLVAACASLLLVGAALLAHRLRGHRAIAAIAALAAVLPLPLIASDPLDAAPARDLAAPPRILEGIRREGTGRVFAALHDRGLLDVWMRREGSVFSADHARRAHEALAGYANLAAGVPTATSPSPIGSPRLSLLIGASLAGGNPARLLALSDVGTLVTPFPASIRGARLTSRVDGVSRYDLPGRAGRVFFVKSVAVAGDAEAFEAIRRPDFDPEARAFVASSATPLPPAAEGRGFAVAKVLVDRPEETEIAVTSSKPSFLVLTRSFDPGWQASVDDLAVAPLRTDLAFMGLAVPAGEHRLVFRYRPSSFRIGAIVSAASLFVLGALWLAGSSKK